ncbi:MAG: ribonuclease R [Lachnospiraceae bacterium]|nr:ribonuclease R [Lachnospiraceae bacterium]
MSEEEKERRKEMLCKLVEDDIYVPMKEKELAAFLQVKKEDRDALRLVLDELVLEGKLELTPKRKYVKGSGAVMLGTFISNAKGFGFVRVDGQEEDYFISPDHTGGAFDKDTVQIHVLVPNARAGRRKEAEVVSIVSRGITQVVGLFQKSRNFGFVVPDNTKLDCDIFVSKNKCMDAKEGDKVVVKITDYGTADKNPEGEVIEVLGDADAAGVDVLSIIREYELPLEFEKEVEKQAALSAKELPEEHLEGRKDLRDMLMVTIDGEDAKDLDDAVSLSKEGDIYHLGVHIADVSNYVREKTALDKEALKRGTSVYLVDRVIPMLPRVLSNGMCSLNEGEDRLALSCLMDIDKHGKVVSYEIAESVIRSKRRMTYTAVNKIITDHDPETMEQYKELVPMFLEMKECADILRANRKKRGSIDFDLPECKIILDKDGKPVDIKPYERNAATMLIEDFMLAANETIAENFYWQETPFVYRTHDNPDPDKIQQLSTFIGNLGYGIKTKQKEVHPKEIQQLLAKTVGTEEEALISRLALRSMKQAKYSTECTGHFGLACTYYCHFTSPIRRYPDLQIHRIIKEYLHGSLTDDRLKHYEKILPEVATHSSQTERKAADAERESDKLKKVMYMTERIGEEFDGVISGITGWGAYVELPNTVEGLIPVSSLIDDYYLYEEKYQRLIGERNGRVLELGKSVRVKVRSTDLHARTIDFELID